MFLRDHAPDVIPELSRGLALATVRCSCEYFAELAAFEEVIVRMSLAELVQKTAIGLAFEYWRKKGGAEELVARGGGERQGGLHAPARGSASYHAG